WAAPTMLRVRRVVVIALNMDSAPVKVNAIFETQDGEVIGTTDAKVKRVEWQDDGSITVVVDYWPQPAEPVMVVDKSTVPSDDVLTDALNNLEHDNYEQSYSGYKNRQAD